MADKPVVFITGGGQGIGKATAHAFLTAGYRAVIVDVDRAAGEETATEYSGFGEISFIQTDVADEKQVITAIDQTTTLHGRIDVLINNAGIAINKPIEELNIDEWRTVISVNLDGAFLCSKYAAPSLKASGGSIVNIASTRALMSEPHTEAYSASKGGLVALTHALALSLAPRVRVNCISPGWIDVTAWKKRADRTAAILSEEDHRQHPAGRVGQPEDIARLALFLADPGNGFITGQNFVVDGGMTKKMIYAGE